MNYIILKYRWILILLCCLATSKNSWVSAQVSEIDKLLLEAKQQQYKAPHQSLLLYEYVLKEDSERNIRFLTMLSQLETYQILGQYDLAVKSLIELNLLKDHIEDNELLYKYWREKSYLYYSLQFHTEAGSFFTIAREHQNRLPVIDQEHNKNKLRSLDLNFGSPENEIISLKQIHKYWEGNSGVYTWISYKLGNLYFEKNKDSARFYFNQVIKNSNPLLDTVANINLNLLKKESLPEYLSAQSILKNNDLNFTLKYNLLDNLVKYWKKEMKLDSLVRYQDVLNQIKEEELLLKRKAKTILLEDRYHTKEKQILEKEKNTAKQQKNTLIVLSIILSTYIIFFIFRKIKSTHKRNKEESIEENKSVTIPDKTEEEILKRLETFEKTNLFLDDKIRIATLAKHLQTNTKYLSAILNKTKNKSFNTYINHLRINYIVMKLQTDSQYLNYKISYLAKESGFASQSSFSSSFKEVTGKTPSTYIKEQASSTS